MAEESIYLSQTHSYIRVLLGAIVVLCYMLQIKY